MTSKGLEDTGTWWLETFSRLSFNLYDRSQKEKISLENQFRDAHARQGLAIDRLLGVGSGGVHVLVMMALMRSDAPLLAVLALATALEQFMNGFLAIRLPTVYIRWRFVLYAFNIMWSMIMANLLVYRLHFNYCRSTGGALFWAGELVNTSLPWLCLHGLVFPLPFHHALIVNGVATLTLITNNIGRCQKSLGACPAGGPHFQALQQWLSKGSSVFWATMPRHGGGTGGEVPVAAEPLSACVASYAIFHILGYVVTMHALWMCEHAARLSFIKRTEHITIKWRLEQLGSRGAPRLMRLLELAAVVLVATVTVHAALPFGMKLGGMSEAWSKVAAVGWQ